MTPDCPHIPDCPHFPTAPISDCPRVRVQDRQAQWTWQVPYSREQDNPPHAVLDYWDVGLFASSRPTVGKLCPAVRAVAQPAARCCRGDYWAVGPFASGRQVVGQITSVRR